MDLDEGKCSYTSLNFGSYTYASKNDSNRKGRNFNIERELTGLCLHIVNSPQLVLQIIDGVEFVVTSGLESLSATLFCVPFLYWITI